MRPRVLQISVDLRLLPLIIALHILISDVNSLLHCSLLLLIVQSPREVCHGHDELVLLIL